MKTKTADDPVCGMEMPLTGMHCASCAARIEKGLAEAPGVVKAAVNFATSRATVQYDRTVTDVARLQDTVRSLGYDVLVPETGAMESEALHDAEEQRRLEDYARQRQRFIIALLLTVPVAILAMAGHLVPALREAFEFPARPWIELALTTPVLFWAGREFFLGAWAAARHRAADMNTLVAIGTLSAYSYSLVATVAPDWFAVAAGHAEHAGVVGIYYEVAAIIVNLILMGRLLEARARSRTSGAIRALMDLAPKLARVERDGGEQDIPVAEGQVGEVVLVRPG
jgi:Cu+-exporting ATPase